MILLDRFHKGMLFFVISTGLSMIIYAIITIMDAQSRGVLKNMDEVVAFTVIILSTYFLVCIHYTQNSKI